MDNKVNFINDSDDALASFIDACNDTISAKYLLAERKIAVLLSSIANSERLYKLFEQALNGYNRHAEWRRSVVTVGTRSKLVLPQNQSKLMAFVFCLLMELDSGKRSLRDLLDEYFFHTNPNEEFTLFCKTVIIPFRDVTEFCFINGIDAVVDDESVDVSLREEVKALLSTLNSAVNESVSIDLQTKHELFTITRSIESALTPNRVDLVKPLLIGFRAIAQKTEISERLVSLTDKLTQVFIENDIF